MIRKLMAMVRKNPEVSLGVALATGALLGSGAIPIPAIPSLRPPAPPAPPAKPGQPSATAPAPATSEY